MIGNSKISNLQFKTYQNVDDTLSKIKNLIKENAARTPENSRYDVFDNYDLEQMYNYVRSRPYVTDPLGAATAGGDDVELLKAPWATDLFGGDCDCKSIFLGMYFERHGMPYRMAVTSTRADKELHHIYPEIWIDNKWLPFDATYPLDDKNYVPSQPFKESPYTLKRIYDWSCGDTVSFETTANTPDTHGRKLDCNNLTGALINSNDVSRIRNLHGENMHTSLNGAQLAILHGNQRRMTGCTSCQNKKRNRLLHLVKSINGINDSQLLGSLGFDPVTIATSVVSFISQFFGSRPAYVDAYHAYTDAISQMQPFVNTLIATNNADQNALVGAATLQGVIAVLLVDVMNPPGADLCTPPGDSYYCGNRAKWDDVKQLVISKATQVAPFFAWRMLQHKTIDGPSLVAAYQSFKNHTGDYSAFISQYPSGTIPQIMNQQGPSGTPVKTPLFAGMNSTTLLVAGVIGVFAYEVLKKKKRTTAHA